MNSDGMAPKDANGKPVVFEAEGRALAHSGDVAAYFSRPHRSVLRSIRGLLALEPSLDRSNFVQVAVPDVRGRLQPAYDMDRDGFTLLAMGFTGLKALRFKLAYVNAFKAHANAGFFYGASLADPTRLLEGDGKRMRHVKLRPGQDVNVKALSNLIAAAYDDIERRLTAGPKI